MHALNINVWSDARCCANLIFELRLPTALPLLKHLGQFVQSCVVEVKDLVLALSAGDDQLSAGARFIAEQTNTLSETGLIKQTKMKPHPEDNRI